VPPQVVREPAALLRTLAVHYRLRDGPNSTTKRLRPGQAQPSAAAICFHNAAVASNAGAPQLAITWMAPGIRLHGEVDQKRTQHETELGSRGTVGRWQQAAADGAVSLDPNSPRFKLPGHSGRFGLRQNLFPLDTGGQVGLATGASGLLPDWRGGVNRCGGDSVSASTVFPEKTETESRPGLALELSTLERPSLSASLRKSNGLPDSSVTSRTLPDSSSTSRTLPDPPIGSGVLGAYARATLAYLSARGDVQTCAVLSVVLQGTSAEASLDTKAVNAWVRAYAELLHRLRLFSQAAEVLSCAPDQQTRELSSVSTNIGLRCGQCETTLTSTSTKCKCGKSRPGETSTKNTCNHCAVCRQIVRGVYTWCIGCGHGGHAEHMKNWFAHGHTSCPAACGHQCTAWQPATHRTQQRPAAMSPLRALARLSSERNGDR